MRIALQPSFILHTRPYRDTSVIVEVFTAEHGRFSAVARGVRGSAKKGKRVGLLQPFVPLLLSFTGRAELKSLGGIESAGAPLRLQGERMFSGLYLNELLVRLLHRHDAYPELFAAYADVINTLATTVALDAALRPFELFLLRELGYTLELDVDGQSGDPIDAQTRYRFHAEQGLVALIGPVPRGVATYLGADLLLLAAGEFAGSARKTAKLLLREALGCHLGGIPLRSRELFRASGTQVRKAKAIQC